MPDLAYGSNLMISRIVWVGYFECSAPEGALDDPELDPMLDHLPLKLSEKLIPRVVSDGIRDDGDDVEITRKEGHANILARGEFLLQVCCVIKMRIISEKSPESCSLGL